MKKIIISFLIFFLFYSLTSAQISTNKNVLILHSYHIGYEWTESINRGLLEVLEDTDIGLNIFIEFLDTIRFPDTENLDLFEKIYKRKYLDKGIIFDVIICSDDNALDFILDKRETFLKNIPVVFCGINEFRPHRIKGYNNITGVNEEKSIRETIEAALKIVENSNKIVVVSGTRLTEKINLNLVKDVAPIFEDRATFLYLDELEAEELVKALNQLKPNDIVLYLTYLSTPAGKYFSVEESIELVTTATEAKVFGITDFMIKPGVIGGKVVHGYSQGTAAAELAIQILHGKPADEIPVLMESPNKYVFNGNMLHKYKISEKILPFGSIVINRPARYLIEEWDELIKESFFGYDLFAKNANIMFLIDPASAIIIDANQAAMQYYGYPDLIGMNVNEINTLSIEEIKQEMSLALKNKKHYFNFKHRLADGNIRDVEVYSHPIQISNTNVLFSIVLDITEQLKTENLIKSRNKLIFIIIIVFLFISVLLVFYLLQAILKIKIREKELKASQDELKEKNKELNCINEELKTTNEELEQTNEELENTNEELKEANEKVSEAYNEKTLLLREIHHRVKNNLLLIQSMLSIQQRYLADKDSIKIFDECKNRIHSMALIHESLYRTGNLSKIEMNTYIHNLIINIQLAYSKESCPVEFQTDIQDIVLTIEKAMPIGLIINELLTNSFKHAFKKRDKGLIVISFKQINNKLKLTIKDDGIGLPDNININEDSNSYGLKLISILLNQLEGKLEVIRHPGTEFILTL